MDIPGTEIFRVLYGSHAHGTNTPASDEDWRGVYLLPSSDFLGLDTPKTTAEDKPKDEVYWELGHFCRLLLKGNPNIVGMLFAPGDVVKTVNPAFQPLVSNRRLFLHEGTMRAYTGWVERELRDLRRLPPEAARFKRLSHVPRLLGEIQSVVNSGGMSLNVRPTGIARDWIMQIKTGGIGWGEALDRCDVEFRTVLPEVEAFGWLAPPRAWLLDYLLETREDYG